MRLSPFVRLKRRLCLKKKTDISHLKRRLPSTGNTNRRTNSFISRRYRFCLLSGRYRNNSDLFGRNRYCTVHLILARRHCSRGTAEDTSAESKSSGETPVDMASTNTERLNHRNETQPARIQPRSLDEMIRVAISTCDMVVKTLCTCHQHRHASE